MVNYAKYRPGPALSCNRNIQQKSGEQLFVWEINQGRRLQRLQYSVLLGLIFTVRTTKNVKPEIMFMFHIWLPSNLN